MFLVKNSTAIRPKLLATAETLLNEAVPAVLRLSHSDAPELEAKCFKFRPSKKAKEASCYPVKKYVPYVDRNPLKPCKTDKQLAVQHPKYLGVYPRCKIPYKPEFDCMDPCEQAERIDDTMYTPSASLDRKYERYWAECSVRKTKRCCRKVPPERSYRKKTGSCHERALPKPCFLVNPMPCKADGPPPKCPRFQLCDCPELENAEVNCRLAPRRRRCRRKSCMYPSFSECQHEELNVRRPIECRCLEVPPMCLVFREEAKARRNPCDPLPPGYEPECD